MKIPDRNRQWKKEVEKALESAEKRANRENLAIENLYKFAADYVVQNRGIKSESVAQEITEQIENDIQYSREVDPDSKLNYKFSFVSSYLYAHVSAGILEEMAVDKIMDYVNQKMDLFHQDYDYE